MARGGGLAAMAIALLAGCGEGSASEPTLPRISSGGFVTVAPTTTTTIPDTYVVAEGDTLMGIAERFGVDVNALAAANGIADLDNIQAGQTLAIPKPAPATTSSTTGG